MKRVILFILVYFFSTKSYSQEIVNIVLVGDNGITENIKEAHSFVAIKKYPGYFQRLDYKLGKPLQKLRSYSDSTLTVLQGAYYEYDTNGALTISGEYDKNLKIDEWYYYNDTGKVVLEEHYKNGVLIKKVNPDTVKDNSGNDDDFKKGDIEATFKKGDKDWVKYLSKSIDGEVGAKSVNGGNVIVNFVVDKEGKVTDVHLSRSVEFILDEEALRVIDNSPLWYPAIQRGKAVNAYRRQPITFVKQ
jgi:periplasmic protein TonB